MKKLLWALPLLLLLMPVVAYAGTVSFTVTTNLSNEPVPCGGAVTTNCALGTRVYYLQGSSQVTVASKAFATTDAGTVVQVTSNVPLKTYATGLVFSAVVQGKDINGVLIESLPINAAPVDLKPGAAVSLTVSIP